jgi:HEAT repeat protein
VLDRAVALTRSELAFARGRAADVLGQLGIPERSFPDSCFDAVLPLLGDPHRQVVYSAVLALQHIDRDRAAPHILPLADDQDDDIRCALAFALGGVATPEPVEALLRLMQDRDAEVRDWATFGIGQLSEADSGDIRARLVAQLADQDPDVRYEAVIGLARRRDIRALGFLKTMLHADPEHVFAREAAAMLLGLEGSEERGASELLGGLHRLQRWGRKRARE